MSAIKGPIPVIAAAYESAEPLRILYNKGIVTGISSSLILVCIISQIFEGGVTE